MSCGGEYQFSLIFGKRRGRGNRRGQPRAYASIRRNNRSLPVSNLKGKAMKPTLYRLSALLVTFSLGVAIPLFLKSHRSSETPLLVTSSGAGSVVSSRCPRLDELLIKDAYLVISVLSDSEYYLGQRKVALAEISGGVRRVLGNQPVDNQVVFIKSAASVRFETLNLIAEQVRNTNVNCIEFVLDKRKRGQALQSPPVNLIGCTLGRRG